MAHVFAAVRCLPDSADIVGRAVGALVERTDPAALLTHWTGEVGVEYRSEQVVHCEAEGPKTGGAVSGVAWRADIVGRVVLASRAVDGASGRSGSGEMVSSLAGETVHGVTGERT
jgi:hypothetical protein